MSIEAVPEISTQGVAAVPAESELAQLRTEHPPMTTTEQPQMDNAAVIAKSLMEEPKAWEGTAYTLTHKPTGIQLWTASGWAFLRSTDSSSVDVHLGLYRKWWLWKQYAQWKKWQVQTILEEASEDAGPSVGS